MAKEKIIQICGKDVRMIYCVASETGYEKMTGNNISVFSPTFKKNAEGKDVIDEPEKATMTDYIYLALASIVAAYESKKEDAPISSEDILYNAEPDEVKKMIETVIVLKYEWYGIPEVLKKTLQEEQAHEEGEDAPKNA